MKDLETNNPDRSASSAAETAADAKRRTLARGAAELFDSKGYHSTNVGEIAAAAGLSKPTLYHYFRSKADILYWIHEDFIDELIARHAARRTIAMPRAQYLLELMGDMLEVIETRPGVRVFFEHVREIPLEKQESIRERRGRYLGIVEDVLRDGIASGEFRPLDVRLTSLGLFGMCNWAYQWFRPSGALRGREVAYVFWELFIRGIQAPA